MIQNKIGGGDGAVVAVVFGELVFHFAPFGCVVGEESEHSLGEVFWIFREIAGAEVLEELEVAFFLAGDEVMDQHRALRGDGFVDGCATGFANDEVMGIEKLRNFFGPT